MTAHITISVVGDCTLGTDENFNYARSLNAYYEKNGPAYFLKNVKSIFEADDLTIANLEGTFTDLKTRADKTYAFKGCFGGIGHGPDDFQFPFFLNHTRIKDGILELYDVNTASF